ncbi:MAG: NAD-dependent deacylase [Saprospiraceae bacterium]|nr:NAD-dependent deacylase [Saprospiraceae bacterium]MCB9322333.1 NAD-dependent deacylase [Lewinellaceae bacterium]
MAKEKIVVLTGAGISAESGIRTFRDAGGLWEGYDVMEVASPEGWRRNNALVIDFYNQRRKQLKEVDPNPAHFALKELEQKYKVVVVTQNVDNLHERGGSSNIIHLHGELTKVRSTLDSSLVYDWPDDLKMGDKCEKGGQLRPHIVWFGEEVPMLEKALLEITTAHHVIIIGTSMQVYPAAGLVGYAPYRAPIYYVDPKPSINAELSMRKNLNVIAEMASTGVRKVVDQLLG